MTAWVVAAVCSAAALLLLAPRRTPVAWRGADGLGNGGLGGALPAGSGGEAGTPRTSGTARHSGWAALAALAAGGVAVLPGVVVPVRSAVAALLLGVAAAGVLALRAAGRRRAVRREVASRVLELCDELVGELAAGVAPGLALERAADRWPELGPVSTAHRFGSAVPEAFRVLAARPGAGDLAFVAAAWQLTDRTGAGLTEALAAVADALRQQQRLRRVVAAELASARATARLIAGLPLLTLLTGSGIGNPLAFLLGTSIGLACLGSGLALGFAGLAWIEQLATSLERET